MPPPLVAVAHSTVLMPIVVDVQALKLALESELKSKPLFEGHSPEIGAKLLAEEKSIFQKPEKIIEVPYKAAVCQIKKVPRTAKRMAKVGVKSVGCYLQPWKWGSCIVDDIREISETVIDEVKDCTTEQLEVARTAYTAVEQITSKIIDTSVTLNYSGQMQGLSLGLNGNILDVHFAVRVPVSADIKAGILTSNLTAKGVLSCDSVIELDAKVSTRLVQHGDVIAAEAAVDDFHPELKKLCIPGAVEIAEVWSLTGPEAYGLTKLLESVVQKQLQAQAEKALGKAANGLPLNKAITTAVLNLRGPKQLAKDVWLKVEPTKVMVSQIEGKVDAGRQMLTTTAGIEADLSVVYGPKPDTSVEGNLPVLLGASGRDFHLVPRGIIPIAKIREIVKAQLINVAGEPLAKAGFEIPDVKAYQSGQLIVFGVEIKAHDFWGPSGTIYLSGKPVYSDASRAIHFEDLDFTVATKSWLVKNVGALGHDKLVAALAQKAVIPVDERLDNLLSKFYVFRIDIGGGFVDGKINSAKLGGVWIQGDALNFDLILDGTSNLELKL